MKSSQELISLQVAYKNHPEELALGVGGGRAVPRDVVLQS